MKLYNSIGPNPRVVRMFMAEKGIDVPKVEIDLLAGENRRDPYLKLNPSGQMPVFPGSYSVSGLPSEPKLTKKYPLGWLKTRIGVSPCAFRAAASGTASPSRGRPVNAYSSRSPARPVPRR